LAAPSARAVPVVPKRSAASSRSAAGAADALFCPAEAPLIRLGAPVRHFESHGVVTAVHVDDLSGGGR
jgi:hypothetical protein